MRRRDPFRTLDDPDPAPVREAPAEPAEQIVPESARVPQWLVLGELRVPVKRPGWFRRLVVWLLLGWRWQK